MTVNPRQSFKLKLCVWIISISLLTFLTISLASMYFSYNEVRSGISTTISSKLDYAVRSLDEGLTNTTISSDNIMSVIKSPQIDKNPDTAFELCEKFLEVNPRIQGVALGFEPNVVPGHPDGFCPYVMRTADGFINRNLADEKDYRSSGWYKEAHDSGEACWADPFRESNGTIITSYNVPLKNEDGVVEGIAAVDLNMSIVSDSLLALKPYKESELAIIDSEGRFIAHSDSSFVLNGSIDANLLEAINAKEEYYVDKIGKEDLYYFYKEEEQTGWTVLLSIPGKVMRENLVKMNQTLLLDMLIGIILLLVVTVYIINKLTKPLETFAKAAREISHGHFNFDLPVIKDHNELYDLRQALCAMEVSLDNYIKRLEETTSKKAAIESQLAIARDIQMTMVPKTFPPYPDRTNVDIFASLTPAQAVGGDLYDYALCGDTLFFCIGDVSGKGVPASLMMAITRTLFHNTVSEDKTPAQVATILNNSISEGNEMTMFVTMFIASFNLKTGLVTVCNCGHNPPATNGNVTSLNPMIVSPGETHHLLIAPPVNIAIGVFGGYEFKEVEMTVKPGASLLLYTDGVTEAENDRKEQYSEKRLIDLLDSLDKDADSRTIVEALVADVKKFVGRAPQSDDITVLSMKCDYLG